jgi:hypothetical protein
MGLHFAHGIGAIVGFMDVDVSQGVEHADEQFAVDDIVFDDEEAEGQFLC